MTHIVNDACIKCKYMDCVEVCPVDCFHEGMNALVIDPEVCIDCGLCIPECPIGAILPDTQEGSEQWVDFNQNYSKLWPVITIKGSPPADADEWRDVPDKISMLDPRPAKS